MSVSPRCVLAPSCCSMHVLTCSFQVDPAQRSTQQPAAPSLRGQSQAKQRASRVTKPSASTMSYATQDTSSAAAGRWTVHVALRHALYRLAAALRPVRDALSSVRGPCYVAAPLLHLIRSPSVAKTFHVSTSRRSPVVARFVRDSQLLPARPFILQQFALWMSDPRLSTRGVCLRRPADRRLC